MSRSSSLALAIAATLACANASAASYEGNATMGKLRFEVTDLTENDTLVAGYSFNTGSAPFVGSLTTVNIGLNGQPSHDEAPTMVTSSPLTTGEYGSPFDSNPLPAQTVQAFGQTAESQISGNAIRASLAIKDSPGYFAYAEAALGALNLGAGRPAAVQNALLLAPRTQVTIYAQAYIYAGLAGDSDPSSDAIVTAYASLIGGSQLSDYISINQGDSAQRASRLTTSGISFIGMEGVRLNSAALPQVNDYKELTLTFINDTDEAQGYSFLADVWINGNGTSAMSSTVPEPEAASLALVGLLISGVALRRRRA